MSNRITIRDLSDGYRVDNLETKDREQNSKILTLNQRVVELQTQVSQLREVLREFLEITQRNIDEAPGSITHVSHLLNQI